ncbi:MAG: CbiX/SirB N-terminal domain-containing protein [Thermodesulfovibrio sp.]
MYKVIILAHGSQNNDDRDLSLIIKKLSELLNKEAYQITLAYLKHGNPSINQVINHFLDKNTKQVIVHPFFLSSGTHVTRDIPKIIEKIKEKYPHIEVICTEPLGKNKNLAYIIKELINEAIVKQTKRNYLNL